MEPERVALLPGESWAEFEARMLGAPKPKPLKSLSARRDGAVQVSEADFQRQVLQIAGLRGWRTAHFRTAMNGRGKYRTAVAGDGKGFPDLLMIRETQIVVAELKAERGTLSPEQKEWLAAWEKVPGVVVRVWRPRDWPEIEQVLR